MCAQLTPTPSAANLCRSRLEYSPSRIPVYRKHVTRSKLAYGTVYVKVEVSRRVVVAAVGVMWVAAALITGMLHDGLLWFVSQSFEVS